VDENTKIVLISLIQAIVTIAGYFVGFTAGKRTNSGLK
jgi:hypothetical protein